MNTVAELAKANAQEIFDKVEEHLLFITEFSTIRKLIVIAAQNIAWLPFQSSPHKGKTNKKSA